jgi:hypothetical protein
VGPSPTGHDGAVDPIVLILLVGLGGVVASVVTMRRMAGDEERETKAGDPRSVLVGVVLMLAAVAVAYVLVTGAMR